MKHYLAPCFLFLMSLVVPQSAVGYPISTSFSSYQVLNEAEFLSRYTISSLITDLYDKGDNGRPDSWVIRGYWGGNGFWEDVSFGFERGLPSPYPILRTGGSAITRTPVLAISVPDNMLTAVPIAVYTDQGFFGILPDGADDEFFPLYPAPGREAVTTIFSIHTVTGVSPIPVPQTLQIALLGLAVLVCVHCRCRCRRRSH